MKKGFTLIELLAVIVILAIIAVIAIPIILGIIDDVRKDGNELSIEMYGRSVEKAVAAYELKYTRTPTDFNQLTIEYDGNRVECETKKIYEDGSFYLANCKVNDVLVENYTYGTMLGECILNDKDSSNGASLSDEITCAGQQFYVMETSGETVTMMSMYNLSLTSPYLQDTTNAINPIKKFAESLDESDLEYINDGPNIYHVETGTLLDSYISAYENYLKGNGVRTANAQLVNLSQLQNIGCEIRSTTCSPAPLWVTSTNYWTKSAMPNENSFGIWSVVGTSIQFTNMTNSTKYNEGDNIELGIRPVVTISTSEIR